ncbi:hypothetical protein FS837_004499 [Tulasnella sp. UAMH 9824]|nr:hypothetical protein FS837_004499 [Tulasnella sp. UAMH 9824]
MENLPVEILTVILLWATSPGQRRLRRRVSLVCRTWNTIISQNRLFWTEIGLHRSGKEFQEVLKRNPAGPLDVSWTPGSIIKPMPYSAERLMKMASAESQRWRSLTVAGQLPSWVEPWFLQVPTPQLTDINLCLVRRFQRPELPKFHLTSEGCSLHNVVLGYVTLDWDCSRMTGLRSLRIQGLKHNQPTLPQLHTIISSSPELEVLALTSWEWEAAGSPPAVPNLHPMALNFLKTLILDSINPVVVEGISSFTIAPNCNSLKLHRIGGNMVYDQPTASHFVDLLRGPLREASGLFLDYNQPRGEIIFGTKEEEEGSDELGIRAATSKLAKRRGLYFNVSLASAVQNKSRAWNDLMRTSMGNVFQPALAGIQLPIEFRLRGPGPHPTMDSLPKELFIQILLHVIGFRNQAYGRSRLVRVSSAWKRTIEDCFLFWTEALVHGDRVPLQEVLSHNPNGPLDVRLIIGFLSVANEKTLERLALVSEHSRRWRSLAVQGALTHDVIVHCEKPSPNLKTIFIAAYQPGFERPRSLALGQTGNFRDLHLASIDMDWNSHHLSGLRSLRLHSLDIHQTPSLEQLAVCLRASPQLRVLVLAHLAGSEARPTTKPERIAFQFLSLTTLVLYNVPKDIMEYAVFFVEAPNCNSLTVCPLDVAVLQSTHMVGHLKSLLQRHVPSKNPFTLNYSETIGSTMFRDHDEYPPNGWVQRSGLEEGPGIVLGFQPEANPAPSEETHQLLGECYALFDDVLKEVLSRQDAFNVTLLLEHQRRPEFDQNGVVSSHPYTFPPHFLSHTPFITRIATEGWYNWASVLHFLSRPQRNLVSGEETWPCPNLKVVELEKDVAQVELWEVEEMDISLNRFVKVRSAKTALQSVRVVDLGEDCVHLWERGQGWSNS